MLAVHTVSTVIDRRGFSYATRSIWNEIYVEIRNSPSASEDIIVAARYACGDVSLTVFVGHAVNETTKFGSIYLVEVLPERDEIWQIDRGALPYIGGRGLLTIWRTTGVGRTSVVRQPCDIEGW